MTAGRRLRRRIDRPRVETVASARASFSEAALGPFGIVGLMTACGLLAGWGETGLLNLRGVVDPRVTPELLRLNHHANWMIPVSNGALWLALGLPISALAWRWPRIATRAATFFGLGLGLLAWLLTTRVLHPIACAVLAAGVASRLAPVLRRRSSALNRCARLGPPTLLAVTALGIGIEYPRVRNAEARALAALPPARDDRPNVLLIVLDTVRADHLSLYGYERETTPNLERLVAEGVWFEHARAPSPWTLPSHASLFTGRWPFELSTDYQTGLDGQYPTLAEVLADQGYVTAGFVANTHYANARFGLDRGFARYEDFAEVRTVSCFETFRSSELGRRIVELGRARGVGVLPPEPKRKSADRINGDFLDWLEQRPDDRPFFAFLNYFDAHNPYIVPEGFDQRFGRVPRAPDEHTLIERWHEVSKWEMDNTDLKLVRDAYDDCLAYLDDRLGRLFDALKRRGRLEDTLVVITSDHGESLGEHQLFGHGRSLYRPEVGVPLVIVGPDAGIPSGRSIAEPVSLRDVPATLADLLELPQEAPFPGYSLASTWRSNNDTPKAAEAQERVVYAEMTYQPVEDEDATFSSLGTTRALVEQGLVYIQTSFGFEELYDLEADPSETRNLASRIETRPTLLRFRERLQRLIDKSGENARKAD